MPSLATTDTTKALSLDAISDVQGINALSPTKPLAFDKSPLCIVYGRNGAGKSGYVRLLKHACGSRRPGALLGDIFGAIVNPQSAQFTFTEEKENVMSAKWNGIPIPALRGVEIYDTACGLVYVNEESEVAYEPWLLRFFTKLTETCTTLSNRIKKQTNGMISKKPSFPAEFETTMSATWYANLKATTPHAEVKEKAAWNAKDESDLADIIKRLAEPDPMAKATALGRQKKQVLSLVAELRQFLNKLSSERCIAHIQLKAASAAKRKAADEDAKKVFEKAPLSGIGSETWLMLWEASRRYATEIAYKDQPFPVVGEDARCVLCQRELDDESRDRFIAFETFVEGELQRLATEATQNYKESIETFQELPAVELMAIKMDAAGITDEITKTAVLDFASQLGERRRTCLSAVSMIEVSSLPTKETLIRLVQIARDLEKKVRIYKQDSEVQKRPHLEQARKELSARQWINQQLPSINEEIERLKVVSILEAADRLTNTTALSKRKSIIIDELITKAYQNRFQIELDHLGASRLSIDISKSRSEVGRVYYRLSMRKAAKNLKTADILSEGELRIVTLAAFLADTEGRGSRTPFIFDDPISSLDHVYEEATAKRLAKLCESRQVIVFTHRLSLVAFLEKYAAKHEIKPKVLCLSRYIPGEITDLPINLKKTDKAAHSLLNERLAAARRAYAKGDMDYEKEATVLCHDIRVLLERVVEMDLMNEVVRRFNPEVSTKGKIHALAKITNADCDFIDGYMTKYSRYEHSQSEEAPLPLLRPDEIEADLNAIGSFIKTLRERKKP